MKIYQNFFLEEQKPQLDPAFIPHDWTSNPEPEFREMAVFRSFHGNGLYKSADYTGVLSQKFGLKTHISGERFLQFIHDNEGYDVYFINPFPQNAYFTHDVWEQAENSHPGIRRLAQQLFDIGGVDIDLENFARCHESNLLYCNFWVGSQSFWDEFMKFINKFIHIIMIEMPDDMSKQYFDHTDYRVNDRVEFFPFIFERMFTTYLILNPGFKSIAYRHNEDEIEQCCLSRIEYQVYQNFRDIVDAWDAEGPFTRERRHIMNGMLQLMNISHELYWKHNEFPC